MKLEELNKLIDLEINWLRYYTLRESRKLLNEKSEIYTDLKPMNYAKRIIALDLRCCPCIITSKEIITEELDLDKLEKLTFGKRGENKLSPIETYIKIFPNQKMDILNRLKNY